MIIYYKDVTNTAKRYLSEKELQQLDKAYLFAKKAHHGQTRASGEDFIHHPLAVTLNLVLIKASVQTLIAGLLHDVVEDCDVTLKDIEKQFGEDIANLVDGVTKIDSLTNTKRTNILASNIKKVLLSGISDVRVLIIKLCDRMHNISTLSSLSEIKRKRIATETLEIYRPLALKLSLFNINKVFEEEAFKWAYPEENTLINKQLKISKKQAMNLHDKIVATITGELHTHGIENAKVLSREKTNYAIYNKIYKKGKRWEKLFDILAVRVILKDMSQCFSVLGIMHKVFKHIPKTFKDYITIPKDNGYQSIHTCLSYEGFVFEAQIRTEAMDQKANVGIASTWTYKKDEKLSMLELAKEKHNWLLDIQDLTNEKLEDAEFVESFYSRITSRNIYTFTPTNDIIIMERGATTIDFAYRIHTNLGNHFSHALINNQRVDFDHILTNGSVINIVTNDEIQVVKKWLKAAKTKIAIQKIKKTLVEIKNKHKSVYEEKGQQIINKFISTENIKKINLKKVSIMYDLEINTINDLYEAIGRKIIEIHQLQKVKDFSLSKHPKNLLNNNVNIDDKTFKGEVKQAKCCKPIPGDLIKVARKNNVLKLHRTICINAPLKNTINATWKYKIEDDFVLSEIKLRIEYNKASLSLNKIINRVVRNRINIIAIKTFKKYDHFEMTIEVTNINTLNIIISSIEALPFVRKITRLLS